MARRAGLLKVAYIAIAVGLAMSVLHACGGDDDERTTKLCEVCEAHVDRDCFNQCKRFCREGEDCQGRCDAQCDECRRDLRCVACSGSCTGTVLRCASLAESVTCDDGQFGGTQP